MTIDSILQDIKDECTAQQRRWKGLAHAYTEWMSILGEEYGESCKAANVVTWGGWGDQPLPLEHLRGELIQVAAVCASIVAQIDCIEQKGNESTPMSNEEYNTAASHIARSRREERATRRFGRPYGLDRGRGPGRPKGSEDSPRTPFDAYLASQGLSYAEVGRRLGVSREIVRLWADGVSTPTPERIPALAQALDVPEDEVGKWWG